MAVSYLSVSYQNVPQDHTNNICTNYSLQRNRLIQILMVQILYKFTSIHQFIITHIVNCRATLATNIIHMNIYVDVLAWYDNVQRTRFTILSAFILLYTVYPKKYAPGFCFAVLCCGYTLTDFPISIRLTSLALWQSNDCPSASKATLMNMDKYFMWIHYERLHNHNKTKHNKTVCIFLGIYCILLKKYHVVKWAMLQDMCSHHITWKILMPLCHFKQSVLKTIAFYMFAVCYMW